MISEEEESEEKEEDEDMNADEVEELVTQDVKEQPPVPTANEAALGSDSDSDISMG